jgi:cephalosporin hydroxylase
MPSLRETIRSKLNPEQVEQVRRALRIARDTYMAPWRMWRRSRIKNYTPLPGGRTWRTAISPALHRSLQWGTINYRYRDIPMLKHPVEIALYMRLIWETRPGTIIEIGTQSGGAAVWMADLLNLFRISGSVVSIDLKPPTPTYVPPNVKFLQGDAIDIGATLTPDLLATFKRPWLIIEDSAHTFAATKAVLEFFDRHLHSREYIVIEDTNIAEMGDNHHDRHPGKAIAEFLRDHPSYEIDTTYCDQYGRNVTGNPNGYLRKK